MKIVVVGIFFIQKRNYRNFFRFKLDYLREKNKNLK